MGWKNQANIHLSSFVVAIPITHPLIKGGNKNCCVLTTVWLPTTQDDQDSQPQQLEVSQMKRTGRQSDQNEAFKSTTTWLKVPSMRDRLIDEMMIKWEEVSQDIKRDRYDYWVKVLISSWSTINSTSTLIHSLSSYQIVWKFSSSFGLFDKQRYFTSQVLY